MISKAFYSEEFVGRREELAFLHEELRAACESSTRLVVIEGEAGIGKSRLIAEFTANISHDATVAVGRCSEQVRAPYLPFVEIVELLDPRSRLPALKPRRQGLLSEEKWAYFGAVVDMLRAQSARRPLALVIEDVQWADNASIDLLQFLFSRLRASRCLLIVTLRTDVAASTVSGAAIRGTASRVRASSIHLRGLHRHEIKHLVQMGLRRRHAILDSSLLAQIEVLAEGNPLFAEELARVALESGGLSFQSQMPLTLEAIVTERLAPFSNSERGTLYRAAAIGESFDAALLCAVADLHSQDVLVLLERAAGVGLVHETQPGRFSFRHALIRRVLADQLLLALASPLHTRIAQELEALPTARHRAAELAYHWSAARVAEKARVWNETAAQDAWNVYAYRDAMRFYTEALRWNYPAGTDRARVYERIGTLLYIDGCGDDPARWFARAREEYESCGSEIGAAHTLLLEADQHWVDARTPQAADAAAAAAATFKRLGHEQMYAQSLLSVARYAVTLGHVDRTLTHLEAIRDYRECFDIGSRAMWHEVCGEAHAVLGNAARAISEFRAAARLAAQGGVSELIAQIENNFALAAFDLGDLDLAAARHQIAVDEAHRTGLMWRVAYSSLNYARTLMCKNDLDRARALTWEALQTGVTTATFKTKAASVGIPLGLRLNDRALIDACADETAVQLAHASGEIQRIASVAAAFAELRVAQGGQDEARSLLSRAIREIPHAHRAWDLFIAIAQWGDSQDAKLARAMLGTAVGRPALRRAYRLLFEALLADAQPSRRLMDLALEHFARMGNRLYHPLGSHAERPQRQAPLTPRQREIAHLIASGATNRGIAEQLHISEHTVEHHVSGIFERLGLHSRAQLAHLLGRQQRE